jgi:nickel/cobalt transporter (NicO) family protein
MQLILRFAFLLFFALVVTPSSVVPPAQAQDASTSEQVKKPLDPRKLLVPRKNADGTVHITAFFDDPVQWVADKQRAFYGGMTTALRDMVIGDSTKAAWWLMGISFLYGIFHAAGPGHGKAVVTSWILATDNDLKRGLVIAAMSAFIQALTAIVAVSVLLFVFQMGASAVKSAASHLEVASYGMIALLGLYVIWTALRGHAHQHTHDHAHRHDDHHHVHDEHCGHAHVPEPQQLRGEWSLTKAFGLALSVGIRPCSGALLVLVAANTFGLYWAGVLSTLAMGLGVFLTISAIAAASVYAKSLAMKIVAHDNAKVAIMGKVLRLGGGVAIFASGALLFMGALKNGGGFV